MSECGGSGEKWIQDFYKNSDFLQEKKPSRKLNIPRSVEYPHNFRQPNGARGFRAVAAFLQIALPFILWKATAQLDSKDRLSKEANCAVNERIFVWWRKWTKGPDYNKTGGFVGTKEPHNKMGS
ncbi:MAG TPA: hypothetical protein VGY77_01375 [Gemmataceae bacterium]|nr:hypothetical protein [Gemmataceae bacterium]